jgi:hypothetical protein
MSKLDYFQDEQKGPITRVEFMALARKLADDGGAAKPPMTRPITRTTT